MVQVTIFDRTKTLDADGGDDTLTESYEVECDRVAVQLEASGGSTDFDFIIDVRLADDVGWSTDWDSLKNKSTPLTDVLRIDSKAIHEVRVRIVNNDGTNTADARVVANAHD